MNDERRKSIAEAADLLGRAKTLLEIAKDEEQEAYDNLPEGIQASEIGQKIEAAADKLVDVIDSLETIETELTEVAA